MRERQGERAETVLGRQTCEWESESEARGRCVHGLETDISDIGYGVMVFDFHGTSLRFEVHDTDIRAEPLGIASFSPSAMHLSSHQYAAPPSKMPELARSNLWLERFPFS